MILVKCPPSGRSQPATGELLGSYRRDGRFEIVNPVIVGSTMYLGNSYDWDPGGIQAEPVMCIGPALKAVN